jgi:hypothetical protein
MDSRYTRNVSHVKNFNESCSANIDENVSQNDKKYVQSESRNVLENSVQRNVDLRNEKLINESVENLIENEKGNGEDSIHSNPNVYIEREAIPIKTKSVTPTKMMTRPSRVKTLPKRYEDFVMDKN